MVRGIIAVVAAAVVVVSVLEVDAGVVVCSHKRPSNVEKPTALTANCTSFKFLGKVKMISAKL